MSCRMLLVVVMCSLVACEGAGGDESGEAGWGGDSSQESEAVVDYCDARADRLLESCSARERSCLGSPEASRYLCDKQCRYEDSETERSRCRACCQDVFEEDSADAREQCAAQYSECLSIAEVCRDHCIEEGDADFYCPFDYADFSTASFRYDCS